MTEISVIILLYCVGFYAQNKLAEKSLDDRLDRTKKSDLLSLFFTILITLNLFAFIEKYLSFTNEFKHIIGILLLLVGIIVHLYLTTPYTKIISQIKNEIVETKSK